MGVAFACRHSLGTSKANALLTWLKKSTTSSFRPRLYATSLVVRAASRAVVDFVVYGIVFRWSQTELDPSLYEQLAQELARETALQQAKQVWM